MNKTSCGAYLVRYAHDRGITLQEARKHKIVKLVFESLRRK